MRSAQRFLAVLLAVLQFHWAFGSTGALAQVVRSQVQTGGVNTGQVPVVAPINFMPGSMTGGVLGNTRFSATGALPSLANPAPGLSLPSSSVDPAVAARPEAGDIRFAAPAPVLTEPRVQAQAQAAPAAAPARNNGAPGVAETSKAVGEAVENLKLSAESPVESSKEAADRIFAKLTGEKLIAPTGPVQANFGKTGVPRLAARSGPGLASPVFQETARPEIPSPQEANPSRTSLFSKPAFRRAAVAVSFAAIAAALPLLLANAGMVAAAGSITLSVIGIPQIIHNFKAGKEGVKDLTIASPLIWFAAATLLSVVSIGQGSSVWWNAANLAGVLESAAVVGQLNWFKRDAKALKATGLTAAAVLAPLPFIALQAFLPLKSWVDLAFTAAMGLLWVLNWPQIKQNYKVFKEEGRTPRGIAPLYPALVVAGSLLHLFAALAGGDLRWAMNASIAILTAGAVLGQLYAPRATNAVVGPIVRLADKAMGLVSGLRHAWLKRRARAEVARVFEGRDLSGFEGASKDAQLAAFVARAKELPGRSLIYLEAPTAAGKSTLAKQLETVLAGRIVTFPVDRYFKSKADLPKGLNGQADWDQPESLYLDRAAADIRTLLAGGRIELPFHDTVAEVTRFASGEFMRLDGDDVLVVDSIYASHPTLVEAGAGRASLNVYLTAPASVRLARRFKRDVVERGISVERNVDGWQNVLANEKAHILGLQSHADMVINLVSKEELEKLSDAYADILAAQWLSRGRDKALTDAFLRVIKASMDADLAPQAGPVVPTPAVPPPAGGNAFLRAEPMTATA